MLRYAYEQRHGQDRRRYCIVFRLSHPEALNHAQDALSTVRRSFSERCLAVDVPALKIVA